VAKGEHGRAEVRQRGGKAADFALRLGPTLARFSAADLRGQRLRKCGPIPSEGEGGT